VNETVNATPRAIRWAALSLVLLLPLPCMAQPPQPPQRLEFSPPADPAALSGALSKLAREAMAVYRDDDRERYLDQLFRLQFVAGRYEEAAETIAALHALPRAGGSLQKAADDVQYEIYAKALARHATSGVPLDAAFAAVFRETFARLDDRVSALVLRALDVDLPGMQQAVDDALATQKGKTTITLPDALQLIRVYQVAGTYRAITPWVAPLLAEDDGRRYLIDRDVAVKTPDGATVCALIVRPRPAATAGKGAQRLPALLNFTIYANPVTLLNEARRTASNGYAGVEGLTRGKGCSPDAPVPYEKDGADAAALIDWIARQPWSDRRVGMFGGSYEGFTQWGAAKHRPKALKGLMPSVAVAPGIDVPMEGNVFQTFIYYWPFYAATSKTLDDVPYRDGRRWFRMRHDWYATGKPYRALPAIDGTPNPFFSRWLEHPSYDAYWQSMIPYREEFARIDIPVLTTTGFYDDAQIGALYYFAQHHQYNPKAEHYLLIGPYDHVRGQRGTITPLGTQRGPLRGYDLDPVARIDLGELRYQWFGYLFKGAPKPALLKDEVNYEVMGANVWKHAPSLAAMGERRLRFHLSAEKAGDAFRLREGKPDAGGAIPYKIDLADRSDLERMSPGGNIVDKDLDTWNALQLVSDPFPQGIEFSGLFSGRLEFVTNKRDFDFNLALYELTAKGEYVELSYLTARASYLRDRTRRQLLTPGERQALDFHSGRLTSRKFQPGSRLVVLLSVIKQPGSQINYGTGKDVSDEAVADAGEPLTIQWLPESFVEIPVQN
jgi:putative CocE/NonD family hydrolase